MLARRMGGRSLGGSGRPGPPFFLTRADACSFFHLAPGLPARPQRRPLGRGRELCALKEGVPFLREKRAGVKILKKKHTFLVSATQKSETKNNRKRRAPCPTPRGFAVPPLPPQWCALDALRPGCDGSRRRTRTRAAPPPHCRVACHPRTAPRVAVRPRAWVAHRVAPSEATGRGQPGVEASQKNPPPTNPPSSPAHHPPPPTRQVARVPHLFRLPVHRGRGGRRDRAVRGSLESQAQGPRPHLVLGAGAARVAGQDGE